MTKSSMACWVVSFEFGLKGKFLNFSEMNNDQQNRYKELMKYSFSEVEKVYGKIPKFYGSRG